MTCPARPYGPKIRLPAREAAEKPVAYELNSERLGLSAPRLTDSIAVLDLLYRSAEAKHGDDVKPHYLADVKKALSPFGTEQQSFKSIELHVLGI